ncbi:hypothetical protein [Leeuwenhoekiella parthenopeia]|uniref:Uncharacterized protein n=1 Tax=Leeuwenhoekiella parthenopeia TaxID=2890320 RepID=A0ABS8GPU3_9FLAO|nr:hypothetical protein [Leeuwenhoekiella parthenopeia]MCC4211705.1 hypothetical protein [Leeuwenhoekiella parthenopeia]
MKTTTQSQGNKSKKVIAKDKELLMDLFEITEEDWHVMIWEYGNLMLERHHPNNMYLLKLPQFWNWYQMHIGEVDKLLVHLIKYEKAVGHIDDRGKKDKNYCLGLIYISVVNDLSISRKEMIFFNKHYREMYGELPSRKTRRNGK